MGPDVSSRDLCGGLRGLVYGQDFPPSHPALSRLETTLDLQGYQSGAGLVQLTVLPRW